MTHETITCTARSMPKQIPVELCVPNPAHPACKQCASPKIDQLKAEDLARLKNQDSLIEFDDELLDEAPGIEPDEEDFEEFKED